MTLTQVEKERYNRHIITTGFGEEGQLKLKAAKVLVIGAGGLGCPVIQYLVAAGVGQIGIVDGDTVSLSNLQRQILYTEEEIGHPKAAIAAAKMNRLNASVNIRVLDKFLTEEFADQLFSDYDLVVGCTDNYNSRYLIDRKSKQHNIPFVHGAIREFEGQLCVFNYKGSPSYSDLFGTQPVELSKPGGVVGSNPGIIGSLMAMEVIKIITRLGKVHSNKLLLFNVLDNSFSQVTVNNSSL
jgi:molybdopterin/thiamine biosynthesis adenylyltransferase